MSSPRNALAVRGPADWTDEQVRFLNQQHADLCRARNILREHVDSVIAGDRELSNALLDNLAMHELRVEAVARLLVDYEIATRQQ